MSFRAEELRTIQANMVSLRDQLRATAEFYTTLCSQLRGVESLSSSVSLDYYYIKNTNDETFRRLTEWRCLERKIFYNLDHHTKNKFQASTLYENRFLKSLTKTKTSSGPKEKDQGVNLKKKAKNVKEGLIAIKYSSEARRRVLHLADFVAQVKGATDGYGSDYWENMAILSGLCSWVREIIYDSSRSSSLTKEKEDQEGPTGQSVYANDVIKTIINFSKASTSKRPEHAHSIVPRRILDMTLSRTDLSLVDEDMKRLHNSKNYVNSQITYYLFNLAEDIKTGNLKVKVLEKLGLEFTPQIGRPLHIYDIHEYYSNFKESSTILRQVHKVEQLFLKNLSLSHSLGISSTLAQVFVSPCFLQMIKRVRETDTPSRAVVQSILSALRTAYFMSRSHSKDLLKIWDQSPY